MTTNEKGKGQVAELAGQLIAGTAKYLTSTTSVVLEGSSYTQAQNVEASIDRDPAIRRGRRQSRDQGKACHRSNPIAGSAQLHDCVRVVREGRLR